MAETLLPPEFADLEPFAATWCLATEPERFAQRMAVPMDEMQKFYDAVTARADEALTYCDKFPDRRHARGREEPAPPPLLHGDGLVPD